MATDLELAQECIEQVYLDLCEYVGPDTTNILVQAYNHIQEARLINGECYDMNNSGIARIARKAYNETMDRYNEIENEIMVIENKIIRINDHPTLIEKLFKNSYLIDLHESIRMLENERRELASWLSQYDNQHRYR